MKASDVFSKLGGTAWLIGAGGAICVLLLHWLGVVNAEQFPWRLLGLLFGVGGFGCFVVASVCSMWNN
ncbi:MAG: hypothetical protein ACYC9L_15890 [Sulfuricaulis sp.]